MANVHIDGPQVLLDGTTLNGLPYFGRTNYFLAQSVEIGGKTFSISYRSFSFSETMLIIELGDTLRTEISGTFQYSEDGQLSGTITGARTVYQPSELITNDDQHVVPAPPETWIEITGASVSISAQQPNDGLSDLEGNVIGFDHGAILWDELILGGDDDITVSASWQSDEPPVIHGYGGDDVIREEDPWTIYHLDGTFGDDQVTAPQENASPELDEPIIGDLIVWDFPKPNDAVFHGDAGNDHITAAEGNDTLFGGDGDDTLIAYRGENRLIGGAGDDSLSGGDGETAVFAGESDEFAISVFVSSEPDHIANISDQSSFAIIADPDILPYQPQPTILVADRVLNREGNDTLNGIDFLEFSNATIDTDVLLSALELSVNQAREITAHYLAVLDRAPDAQGLYFWGSKIAEGMSMDDLAGHLSTSQEIADQYEDLSLSVSELQAIAQSVLNRSLDPRGLEFWSRMAEEGKVDRSDFALELIKGAVPRYDPKDTPEETAQRALDHAYLDSKIDLGLYYSAVKGMSNLDNADAILAGLDGSDDSVDAAKAMIDDLHSDAMEANSGEMIITMVGIAGDLFDG